MLTLAAAVRDQRGGHPLWHLAIVAGGALVVFVVIKANEHWNHDSRRQHPNRALRIEEPVCEPRSRWTSAPTAPILALALASATSGAIHAGVLTEHLREAFIFGAFFLAASTLQAGWAVLVIYRPHRTLLIVAAGANAVVILLWILTRTVGLPIGSQPWRPEPIGALDVTSTLLELAIVLGAANLLARRRALSADILTNRLQSLRAHHPTVLRARHRSRPPSIRTSIRGFGKMSAARPTPSGARKRLQRSRDIADHHNMLSDLRPVIVACDLLRANIANDSVIERLQHDYSLEPYEGQLVLDAANAMLRYERLSVSRSPTRP